MIACKNGFPCANLCKQGFYTYSIVPFVALYYKCVNKPILPVSLFQVHCTCCWAGLDVFGMQGIGTIKDNPLHLPEGLFQQFNIQETCKVNKRHWSGHCFWWHAKAKSYFVCVSKESNSVTCHTFIVPICLLWTVAILCQDQDATVAENKI